MRILDCKSPVCKEIAAGAPVMLDYLCEDCQAHFDGVQQHLNAAGIHYTVNPTIVRGLDYYTRTVFEFVAGGIGAQSTVCGGGRYDGLIAQMGGPATPSLGFAMGLERLLLVLEHQQTVLPTPAPCDLYIAAMGQAAALKASSLCRALRKEGFACQTDLCAKGLKAQMRFANKIGASFTLVLGDDEIAADTAKLKRMADGHEFDCRLSELTKALYQAKQESAIDSLTDSIIKQEGSKQ